MLVTTTFEIDGWDIQRMCGEVFGLTVRSRNVFSQVGAGFKSMFGGELQGMTKNLSDSRNEAMARMLEAARAKGGNAVVGFRFDTSELGDTWTEICAYGTAVVAVPISDGAKQTAAELGYGQPGAAAQSQYQQPPPQQYQQPAPGQYQQPSQPQYQQPASQPAQQPGYSQQPPPQGYPPQ